MKALTLWTRSIWLYVMLLLGAGVAVALAINWFAWPATQKIVAMIFIVLPMHVWEEWRVPGGFAYQYNWIMANSTLPDRYPMNQFTDMLTVFAAMCMGIILLVIGPKPAILINQTFFAFAEVAMHTFFGYRMWRRFRNQGKRTWYNAGYATALTGFLPLMVLGIVTLWHMPLMTTDFLGGLGLTAMLAAITFLPERIAGKRDNDFAFEPGYYQKYLKKQAAE